MILILKKIAMWMVWNVPLGRFAPYVFDFAMGQKGKKVYFYKEE